MSIASNLIKEIDSISEGYGKDNKYKNMVSGPKDSMGNVVTRKVVENDPDKDKYFKKDGDNFEELREYLTDVAEEALNRTNQGGKNPYGKALSLVQATDSKVLADIDKRIQEISKENGLPPVQDMPDTMIKKILKG